MNDIVYHIKNHIKVNSLLLSWQPNAPDNQRYLVGEVFKFENDYRFKYFTATEDFEEAREKGFQGFPAFKISEKIYTNDVLNSFIKRLPPRRRGDFSKFIAQYGLDSSFNGDDFELICHTGVRLPSDGFDLIPKLSEASTPFEYVTKLAGVRFFITSAEISSLGITDNVDLVKDTQNEFDRNALLVKSNCHPIGYVNRLLSEPLTALIDTKNVRANIHRISGTEANPIIYIMISVE